VYKRQVYEGVIDIYSPDIYVDTTGWWRDGGAFNASETPIQSAVDGADPGDTIFVRNGSYTENVDVDRTLTLQGEGADVVTVTAADSGDHVFEVSADWVNLSGFTLTGADGWPNAGVYLGDGVGHCNISNNTVLGNSRGINMYYSSNNVFTNNIVNSNDWYGIYLRYSNNNIITNTTTNSNYNVYQGFAFGIYLHKSCNNTLANNTANLNDIGIYLGYSSNNTLQSNTANLNYHGGIELGQCSSNNTLQENTANLNNWEGIYLSSSNNNMLTKNTANSNDNYGICLADSSNNTLYHNNFINNPYHNVYDTGSANTWDSGSTGNYYSDYNGTDNNTDGIGDTPHRIPGGTSVDRYPLMYPWTGDTSLKGDLNHDGTLTSADALIALEIAVSGGYLLEADIGESGYVNALDALMIMQAAAGTIEL